ncbi:alpha/beta hydrolase [Aureimonas sp. AU4]|uniref:alpha/beta hydrolase n=1 Tax=Aureimonas sp. AU4 TaxID=1638163 RepID=UPI0007810AD6|nr:alpha/beta hydrolase [Aureimonas sp. AU4]
MTDEKLIAAAPFALEAGDAELKRINAEIEGFQASMPSAWDLPLETVRRARREGRGVFPGLQPDRDATTASVRGRGGNAIPLRVLRPTGRTAIGTYLHIHGGGWVFGEAAENDGRLRRLVEATGLVSVSVDYRLAPEHPFPAAPDDCEDAALALLRGEVEGAPLDRLAIGGESAGAHLSVLVLLRLRDRHDQTPFRAVNLVAGAYDLSLTPSVRSFGAERLVLNTQDVVEFVERFVPEGVSLRDPAVSPLYAGLERLPPALFSVGTRDLLLDDTLFMAARWLAAGNRTELDVQPDGCHVFQIFASEAGRRSEARMAAFLLRHLGDASSRVLSQD